MTSNKKLWMIVYTIIMLFSSCTKQNTSTKSETASTAETTQTVTAKEQTEGVIYVHEAALYKETDDGKMKWAAKAALGDMAIYLGETKEAQRTDGQKRVFFHIELNGIEYWIQDYCYQPDTVPAFVSAKDAVLYNSASLTAATDEIIPQYLIIAIPRAELSDETNDSKTSLFITFSAYSSEFSSSWLVKDKFVKRNAIEVQDQNSINAMLIAQTAMEQSNDTIRNELFQNAIELASAYSDTIAELQMLAETITKEQAFMKKIPQENMQKRDETLVLQEDTYLLSIPQSTARDLYMVKEGTRVTVSKSAMLKNSDGESEEWYYLQNKQKKGWVQKAFVKNGARESAEKTAE